MEPYLALLRHLLDHGQRRPTRAVLASTGQPVAALSVFGHQARFDLTEGFPAVTTKRLAFRSVVAELLWFLSGSTNAADLRALGSTIWDEWQRPDGDLGPIYGAQWRAFHGRGGKVVDQIERLVTDLCDVVTDPGHRAARRLLLTAYNPADVNDAALPPCHVLAQWSVDHERDRLSCHLYQRSADVFLGVPYNIASYALLTHLLAADAELGVGELVVSYGDLHLYENHIPQAREQLTRAPYPLPRLVMPSLYYLWQGDGDTMGVFVKHADTVTGVEDLTPDDFRLDGYQHHPALPGEVAI